VGTDSETAATDLAGPPGHGGPAAPRPVVIRRPPRRRSEAGDRCPHPETGIGQIPRRGRAAPYTEFSRFSSEVFATMAATENPPPGG